MKTKIYYMLLKVLKVDYNYVLCQTERIYYNCMTKNVVKIHSGDKIVLSVLRLKRVENSYVKLILGVEKII